MIRRCRHCGLPSTETTTCSYCGCTDHVHESLSPTVARSIILGALAAAAAGFTVTACSGENLYGAPPGYYDAGTEGGSAGAGGADASDAASE